MGNAFRPPPVENAPAPNNFVVQNFMQYAILSGGNPHSFSVECQNNRYLRIPAGWSIAPDNAESARVIQSYPWNTHVAIMNNGCGVWGRTGPAGNRFSCGWLEEREGGYKVRGCHMQILIQRMGPTPNPTPLPIANPTQFPVARPTEKPTNEPTKEPTHLPTFRPSHKPTHEPTVEPTLQPTFKPTHEPTLEPTKYPISNPTENPTKEPTHEPTKSPTLEPSARPSKQPTLEPSHKPTKEPISEPTEHPTLEPTFHPTFESTLHPTSPTLEPTRGPIVGPNFCSYEFVKGKSTTDAQAGCAIILADDLDWLKDGQTSQAVYVCSTEKEPANINEQHLNLLGIGGMSSINPGHDTEVTVYSEDEMQGSEKTFTSGFHPSLVHFHFIDGSKGNDRIKSVSLKSKIESYKLPDFCHDQPKAVEPEKDVV